MPIINTIEGDLVALAKLGRYTEIAHGCNCNCVMGAGIAPQIARAFPNAKEVDNRTKKMNPLKKLGGFTTGIHTLKSDDMLTIFNLYTQLNTGGRSIGVPDIDYVALRLAFSKINYAIPRMIRKTSKQVLGIPMIGAGLAGGDWERIEEIINSVTPDINIELVIYTG